MNLHIKHIEAEIADQFLLEDGGRPWIIGFSGGKDSTMLLQLVWTALQRHVSKEQRQTREIFIVCNNTQVENPKIIAYTDGVLKKISEASVRQDMPFVVHQTQPKLEDTFWLNLLGRGYPAPNRIFRWCTERLKIHPTTSFILEKAGEGREVIVLLGTRSDESTNRAANIKRHAFGAHRLQKHVLPNTFSYKPIKDFLTEEVWEYLMAVPSPWGANNRDLVTLYRNASGGDCPLVIDTSTPSCGQSRFGCWVCTVVTKDKSMEALIDNGEEWMLPLSEFRDLLAESRDRYDWREERRRNGLDGPGPYKPHIRAMLLQKLLEAQREVQAVEPDIELISNQELIAIQVIWHKDGIFSHRVSNIYNSIFSQNLTEMDKFEQQKRRELELLSEVCRENPEHVPLIEQLLDLQKAKILMQRKRGLVDDLENHIERFLKNAV